MDFGAGAIADVFVLLGGEMPRREYSRAERQESGTGHAARLRREVCRSLGRA